jgi:hypothetical protein
MKRTIILAIFVASLLLIAGCTSTNENVSPQTKENTFTVFKSQSCGCCGGYVSYLTGKNLDVDIKSMPDVEPIKDKYNIPPEMRSCHTTTVDKYFVEGHVPIEAVNKMLNEKPDIDGIALPGMPSGSAGMPGPKTEKFKIYSIKKGKAELFMEI